MAPTPVDNSLTADPTSTPPPSPAYWAKANIITTIVFCLFALLFSGILIAFFIHRRNEKRKVTNPTPDKAGLLANEDKTSMFSRNRATSVTLYVDSEAEAQSKKTSHETVSLIPLQLTPAQEIGNPMNSTESAGSGISAMSRVSRATRASSGTQSTMLLSPISSICDDGDMGSRRPGRARSSSATSVRYYDRTPLDAPPMPIPIIVRTGSD
ncbi:hypothetical protein P153DRAFT_201246 [Dothidotthia symphoricarpi CBS 119687]|uniref:Uncharacterized protein n=1 Tax=Dothidotthia symphoricarpi CBS 119687 TaxID=1392245 RepID=A0A6A6AJF4_9PLEO|nr:uncharacterized protein P153DRAFT_201246 [Dothidotthia symphoricarpi CBS 119687]KAF2131696.1 hypothetical protein P153DRAFT_201246 [Dothidotthia symphoricarpi CBS 119687]